MDTYTTGSNPGNVVVTWMDLIDDSGTNLGQYHLIFDNAGINIIAWICQFLASLLMVFANTFGVALMGIIRLITDGDLVLGWLGGLVEIILTAIHNFISPLWIAGAAFAIVVMKAALPKGDFLGGGSAGGVRETLRSVTGKGYSMGGSIMKWDGSEDWGGVRKFLQALVNGSIVFTVILFLSQNPVGLLAKIVDAVSSIGNDITGSNGSDLHWAADILSALYGLVNFGGMPPDQCASSWAYDFQNNTKTVLDCMGQDVKGDLFTVITAVFALVVIVAMAFFMWQFFSRGIIFFVYALWDILSLPYYLAFNMFKPSVKDDRFIFDESYKAISHAAIYVLYYLLAVFCVTSGPALVLAAAVKSSIPVILQLTIIAAVFYFAGRLAPIILNPRISTGRPNSLQEAASQFLVFNKDENGKTRIDWRASRKQTMEVVKTSKLYTEIKDNPIMARYNASKELSEDANKIRESIVNDTGIKDQNDFLAVAINNSSRAARQLNRQERTLRMREAAGLISKEQAELKRQELRDRRTLLEEARKRAREGKAATRMMVIPEELKYFEQFQGKLYASEAEIEAARNQHNMEAFKTTTGIDAKSVERFVHADAYLEQDQREVEQLRQRYKAAVSANNSKVATEIRKKLEDAQEKLSNQRKVVDQKDKFLSGMLATEFVENPAFDPSKADSKDAEPLLIAKTVESPAEKLKKKKAKEKKEKTAKQLKEFAQETGLQESEYDNYNNSETLLEDALESKKFVTNRINKLRNDARAGIINDEVFRTSLTKLADESKSLDEKIEKFRGYEAMKGKSLAEGDKFYTVPDPRRNTIAGTYTQDLKIPRAAGDVEVDEVEAMSYLVKTGMQDAIRQSSVKQRGHLNTIGSTVDKVVEGNLSVDQLRELFAYEKDGKQRQTEFLESLISMSSRSRGTANAFEAHHMVRAVDDLINELEAAEEIEDEDIKKNTKARIRRALNRQFMDIDQITSAAGRAVALEAGHHAAEQVTQEIKQGYASRGEVFDLDIPFVDPEDASTWNLSPVGVNTDAIEQEIFGTPDTDPEMSITSSTTPIQMVDSSEILGSLRYQSELYSQQLDILKSIDEKYGQSWAGDAVASRDINITSGVSSPSTVVIDGGLAAGLYNAGEVVQSTRDGLVNLSTPEDIKSYTNSSGEYTSEKTTQTGTPSVDAITQGSQLKGALNLQLIKHEASQGEGASLANLGDITGILPSIEGDPRSLTVTSDDNDGLVAVRAKSLGY